MPMQADQVAAAIGVDTHAGSAASPRNGARRGAELATVQVPTDAAGYAPATSRR